MLLAQPDLPAADAVEMYVALMNFTGAVHPNMVENVNQVGLATCWAGAHNIHATQHNTVQYNSAQHSAAQLSTTQHKTRQDNIHMVLSIGGGNIINADISRMAAAL